MNSIQLMQRLARHLTVDDPTSPPADALLDILSAINGGLSYYYREMPGIYKRTTVSLLLRAPRDVAVTFTNQYAHTVQGTPFTDDMRGSTVRFANGKADTIVTGGNTVLDDWRDPNVGPHAAKVYSDTVPIQDVIERIIGGIRCYDDSQSQPTPLIRDERLRGGWSSWRNWPWEQFVDPWIVDGWGMGSVGRPRYYFLEPAGVSQGAEPEMFLRLVPFPDVDYTLRFEAELYTQRIRFSDFATAREIFVSDAYLDDIFIPLCEAELITSPFWRDKTLAKTMIDRKQEVLTSKLPKVPHDAAPASNFIGTPRGY